MGVLQDPVFADDWKVQRRHDTAKTATLRDRYNREGDYREFYCKDRDKILYSPFLRRLAGVTQIVSPTLDDSCDFHNRLTHSLEVAQIARRLTEKIRREQPDIVNRLGLISEDIAEGASLAHDFGHPPFGHDGERVLHSLMCHFPVGGETIDYGGYDGNAQAFRILANLDTAFVNDRPLRGLNITRATLASVIKYPWAKPDDKSKFGIYNTNEDREAFEWVREGHLAPFRTPEAEIMDFSDDIVYSVIDVCDFASQDRLDLNKVTTPEGFNKFVEETRGGRFVFSEDVKDVLKDSGKSNLIRSLVFGTVPPYSATFEFQAYLKDFKNRVLGILTGDDIGILSKLGIEAPFLLCEQHRKYIGRNHYSSCAVIDPTIKTVVELLKKLTSEKTHRGSPTTERQYSLALSLRSLVIWMRSQIDEFVAGSSHNDWLLGTYSDIVVKIEDEKARISADDARNKWKELASRLACDIVSSWSDAKAYQMFMLYARPWYESKAEYALHHR